MITNLQLFWAIDDQLAAKIIVCIIVYTYYMHSLSMGAYCPDFLALKALEVLEIFGL